MTLILPDTFLFCVMRHVKIGCPVPPPGEYAIIYARQVEGAESVRLLPTVVEVVRMDRIEKSI